MDDSLKKTIGRVGFSSDIVDMNDRNDLWRLNDTFAHFTRLTFLYMSLVAILYIFFYSN